MPRKPIPQQDANTWGNILNEFLEVSLDNGGALKNNIVTSSKVANGSISESKLSSALATKVNNGSNPTVGGDLSGTASNAQIADNAVTEAKIAMANSPGNGNVLTWNGSAMTWQVPSGGGGVPTTYALGRVRYSGGWPGVRPAGYAYIDWIKSSVSDPDPDTGLLIPGDTISEWS